MLLRVAPALVMVMVITGAGTKHADHKAGSGVLFSVTQDHLLRPMMGMELEVEQEEGPLADHPMRCDVFGRDLEVLDEGMTRTGYESVLRCDGGRVFVVKRYVFRK